ncbi:hypothetical protein C8Q80DRAFT_1098279 [Daedaleopsis nitida]|nr:hypothetical protein C8Q80DRAFT_1098279 [Daedaleopsis nitida]
MGPLQTIIRLPLYIILWVFSALLFILTCVRLGYTLHLPRGDPLNGGVNFYDPIVVELLVCSLLTLSSIPLVLGWVPPIYLSRSSTSNNLLELSALSFLWLLWLIGCCVSTSIWPSLAFCYQFEPCRVLTAMMAFAWLGWTALVGLIIVAILNSVQKTRSASSRPLVVEWATTFPVSVSRATV